jgi:hypothetical protein
MKPRIRWAVSPHKMRMPVEKLRRLLAAPHRLWLLGVALDDRTVASAFELDRRLVVQYRQDPTANAPATVSMTSHTKAEG